MSVIEPQVIQDVGCIDAHVVILNNYIRKHHVDSYRELAKRVKKLTVLLSTPMEPDRDWEAQWSDLDVRVQKNLMFTTNWKHSTGFSEPNFIHIPVDTTSQLKRLKPDIVFSYEMGMRTLLSSWFRRFHPSVPLVMVGNMSELIERERGVFRRMLRWMIRRGVDFFTYNGPSCKRYLESLSISEDKLFHLPYCIDTDSVYDGPRAVDHDKADPTRLLYCGALSQRKGILEFTESLNRWCQLNPQRQVKIEIAGTGKLESEILKLQSSNLEIEMLGNCNAIELRSAYQRANICAFPSFADEWGLVPIEAMASGLPVLGSAFAQSVEAVVQDGINGWIFEPNDDDSMFDGIDRALSCDQKQLAEMGIGARKAVANISAETTAEKFSEIVQSVLFPNKKADRLNSSNFHLNSQTGQADPGSQMGLDEPAKSVSVSIVVPCFNEVESIPNLADHLVRTAREMDWYDLEFVFVDDGSSDDTFDVLSDYFSSWDNARIVGHEHNKGLMAAVMTGAKMARGEIICSIDSDCTYDPTTLVDLLPHLDEGVGMVTGSPYHPEGAILNVPTWRVWISYSASWLYRNILQNRIYCYTSSFRAYRKSAIADIELQNSGFVGTTEILWKLEQNGWQIKEVPSVLSVRQFGQSKIRIVQVTIDHLKMMARILLSKFRRPPAKQEKVVCSAGKS